jgi:GR25 family glycosyltransferase involved in LPS biosynthesis
MIFLNDLFPNIFVINMDKDTQRLELCKQEFTKFNIHTWKRFPGLVSNQNTLEARERCCTLSHLDIIKIAKSNNLDNVLIFEDDVWFDDNFSMYLDKISKFMTATPNWEMLYLGGNHLVQYQTIPFENIVKVSKTYTTHAYALNHTMYDFILYNVERPELSKVQIDVFYANYIHTKGNSYCVNPRVAFQRDGYSNILDRNIRYGVVLGK